MAGSVLFPFTEEHEMIRQAARDFAQKEIAPIAAEFDESGEFPAKTIAKMGEMGFMGIEVPEAYGGAGMDTLAYVLALEEICKADAAHGTIMSVNNSLFCNGIMKFGSEAQKKKYVVPVASGKVIGAYSLTEPMSGSDAGTMRSRAVLNGDHYVINGRKSWVTSGPVAGYVVLFTMTAPEKKHKGITAFLIDASKPGYVHAKKEPKLGIRASATSEIVFEDYRCPVEDRLGEEGEGFKIAMAVLDAGRIGIAAQALGIAEAAYEASVQYAREREAFGMKIGEFQGISFKIADMRPASRPPACWSITPHWPKRPAKQAAHASPVRRPSPSCSLLRRPCSWPTLPCRSTAGWATAKSCPSSAISGMPRSPRFTRAPARSNAW